ncbi:uncharacterized protein LOC134282922 [Saccostrea cucullata]|uniref:uncharacterized protein LOC134282922 n=1 Tax=Saccostrea cuccullata TaxID=36930 RepID=UPI002ED4B251
MLVDSASDCLKKVERELLNKRTEYETRLKAKNSSAMSFAQKVRTHLINSNKKKYLIKTTEGYVPKSATVNIDLAKLEKHFKGKVPDDLDRVSELFEGIINKFDNSKRPPCTPTQGNPAKRLLEENTIFPVKFPNINTGSLHVHSATACAPTRGTPNFCSLPPKKR